MAEECKHMTRHPKLWLTRTDDWTDRNAKYGWWCPICGTREENMAKDEYAAMFKDHFDETAGRKIS